MVEAELIEQKRNVADWCYAVLDEMFMLGSVALTVLRMIIDVSI